MLCGNMETSRLHFMALERMLTVLGGFKKLSFGLQTVIAW